jgi:hypothetical protein
MSESEKHDKLESELVVDLKEEVAELKEEIEILEELIDLEEWAKCLSEEFLSHMNHL